MDGAETTRSVILDPWKVFKIRTHLPYIVEKDGGWSERGRRENLDDF